MNIDGVFTLGPNTQNQFLALLEEAFIITGIDEFLPSRGSIVQLLLCLCTCI